MAVQLPDTSEEMMSEEYNKDNDVKDVIHCDPCKDEDIQVKAVGFCVDCNDYLCTECYQAHTRARSYKTHVLKDRDNIPKSKPKKERKSEKCREHLKEPINWYCKSHDKFVCDICKHFDHRNCMDMNSVTDVSGEFLSSDKLTQVTDRLTHLQREFGGNISKSKENTESVDRHYATIIEEVIRNISKIRNEDLERLKSLEVTCDTIVKKIGSLLNDIETLRQGCEDDRAFVATRKAESQLQVFNERLETVEDDNKITNYRYVCEPGRTADGLLGKMFGWKNRRALNIDDFNVKTSSDNKDSDLTGMERLSDNRIIIANYNNIKIKLVDMISKIVISELKLDWKPWDLTRIDDHTIAITTYNKKKIVFMYVSDTLTVQKIIDKGEFNFCQGIVCSNNYLIVSYDCPRQIQILNMDGTVKQVIEDADGTVRFGDVEYLTQDDDTNILYLSHGSSNKVSSMTLDGQVISSFTHEHMMSPAGITVGRDGRIFVCSYDTNKIFAISSDLSMGQVILHEKDGIIKPYIIIYNDDDCKLYVGNENNNSIQVFLL